MAETSKEPTKSTNWPMGVEYKAEQAQYEPRTGCWVVRRTGPRGGSSAVVVYPDSTAGRKAATEVASRLDQYARLEM